QDPQTTSLAASHQHGNHFFFNHVTHLVMQILAGQGLFKAVFPDPKASGKQYYKTAEPLLWHFSDILSKRILTQAVFSSYSPLPGTRIPHLLSFVNKLFVKILSQSLCDMFSLL
ncbi:MAG: hypothetical protein IKQ96_07365, partial [Lachnospiraceae bacterium]|nr:hypothetical protein [Lachnospiraceae bacterium]